jgi:hypothetical protein
VLYFDVLSCYFSKHLGLGQPRVATRGSRAGRGAPADYENGARGQLYVDLVSSSFDFFFRIPVWTAFWGLPSALRLFLIREPSTFRIPANSAVFYIIPLRRRHFY